MERKLLLVSLLIPIVAIVLFVRLDNSYASLSQQEKELIRGGDASGCKDCVAEMVNQRDIWGLSNVSECEHGPENDSDCIQSGPGYSLDCSEYGPDVFPAYYNADCDCTTCGEDPGCEPLISNWNAWCGFHTSGESAECDDPCETKAGANGIISMKQDMVLMSGQTECTYSGDQDLQPYKRELCGFGENAPPVLLSCFTPFCEPTASISFKTGTRQECDE